MNKFFTLFLIFSLNFSAIRVGYDLSKNFDQTVNGSKYSGNLDQTLVFGYEKESIGCEYILSGSISDSSEGTDILTLYYQHFVPLENDIIGFGRIGYNFFPNYDDGGAVSYIEDLYDVSASYSINGGLSYGIGANFQKFQLSYFVHNGSFDVSVFDSYSNASASSDFKITRVNISYFIK